MSQGITLQKAIEVFQGELGCTGEDGREDIVDIIRTSIEFILLNGGGDILREWIVTVRNGVFTFPRDLETPVKYKLDRKADLGYGPIHSAHYPYSSQSITSCCGYSDWSELNIAIKPNKVATEFPPPKNGVRLIATTRDCRDIGKKIMVNGKQCKKAIYPTHNGHKTAGELLTIYAEDDNEKLYGAWIVDEITGVIKDPTCSYVMLSGIDSNGVIYHLSHYTPDETIPRYTQGALYSCCGNGCDFDLYILGRISPNIQYTRDEELLPIASLELLRLLAKRAKYDESGDFNEVNVLENRIRITIKKLVAYQQAASNQLSFDLAASGSSLSNF